MRRNLVEKYTTQMKMKNLLLILLVGGFISCNTTTDNQDEAMNDNPLLSEWNTPFGTPPFDKIKNEHYKPAFDAAMAEHKAEIEAIINNSDEATFANTIEDFERSGATYIAV